MPNVAYAATPALDKFLGNVNRLIINPLIELLFALAVVFFLYGVVQFLTNQENEESRTQGKQHMVWGVVGITVMLGVWGLLGVVLRTFDIQGVNPEEGTVELPEYNPSLPALRP